MVKLRARHGVKKKPTKAKTYTKTEGTIESILADISNGARIERRDFWNKTEYWIVYPEGGQSKIPKRVYDKIIK